MPLIAIGVLVDPFTWSISISFIAIPPVVLVGIVVVVVSSRLIVLVVLLRIIPPFIFIMAVEDLVLLGLLVGGDAKG